MRRRVRIVREVLTQLLERVAGGILTAAAVLAVLIAFGVIAFAAWRALTWLAGFAS